MTRFVAAVAGLALITANVTVGTSQIHAAPPTVVPSPGYDARLQESRQAPAPYAKPAVAYSRHRKPMQHHRRGR